MPTDFATDTRITIRGQLTATGRSYIPRIILPYVKIAQVKLADGSTLYVVSTDPDDVIGADEERNKVPTSNQKISVLTVNPSGLPPPPSAPAPAPSGAPDLLMIAGYVPGSDVTQHNQIDLDQNGIEAALAPLPINFTGGPVARTTGGHRLSIKKN